MGKNGKKKCGVELVLNGGKETMDSATIPIQWFFSPEVIAKKPGYLLFFEQTKAEVADNWIGSRGRRYLVKVSEATKFIQLFSPGRHRLMVLVFAGQNTEGKDSRDDLEKRFLLTTSYRDCYDNGIPWDDDENESIKRWQITNGVLAAAIVDFVVPEELFAKKPKTAFQKAIWKWVNLWCDREPRDECEYRKRKIFAFTLKPIAWLAMVVVMGIAKAVYRSLATLYIVAGNSLVFLAGFRPQPFGENIANLWNGEGAEWDRARYSVYKLWLSDRDNGYRGEQRMPIAPWEICLIAISGFAVFKLLAYLWEDVWATIFLFTGVVVLVVYSVIYLFKAAGWLFAKLPGKSDEERRQAERRKNELKRQAEKEAAKRREERAAKTAEAQARRAKKYEAWLMENYSVDHKPEKVDLMNLPAPLEPSERAVQVFRVGFWALKAKICRPYSR